MVDGAVLKAIAPEAGFRDRTLANFFAADKLTLDQPGGPLTFTKKDGAWKQTAPKEAEVDSAAIDDLVTTLGRLRAERFVQDKPTADDLKQYGLVTPRAKWTVQNEGKDAIVLLVGRDNFAKLATGDAIVALPAEATAKLVADYRPKKVWSLDEARVESIEVNWAGKTFKLRRQGTGWEDPAAPKDAVNDRAVSELLATLGALKADRWATADAKAAGLEKPTGVITLTLRDKSTRVVNLGAPADGKKLHARTADANAAIFILGEADAAKLTRERAAYIDLPEKK